MLELARPLYAVGGYRLTLLLPMLGAIGAAFAARSIARRGTGSEDAGWLAYWVVGLASPIAVYALDFWEHAPGVACMLGAVALLWGVVDDDRALARAGGAGLLLGTAATMRTEAFVYAVVAVGAVQLLLVLDGRRWRRALHVGIAAVVGFGVPWGANVLLERWLGGAERGGRVGGAATAGLGGLGDRAREAGITLLALRSGELGEMLLIGACSAGLVVGAVLAARRGRPTWVLPLLLAAAGVQVASLASGLGFVPGMFAAAPIALVGLVTLPRSTTTAYPLVVAVAALPFVWAFQFLGGALPQWGGRYALASCILLVAVGAGALAVEGRALRVGLVALSLLVTGSGVLWLQERSREVDRFFDELVARPEDVVVVRNGFFIREGGPAYVERRWLSAVREEDVARAAEVVAASGLTTFATLDTTEQASPVPGARLEGTDRLTLLGDPYYLHTYEVEANMRSQTGEGR
jgi:hypothetical protein